MFSAFIVDSQELVSSWGVLFGGALFRGSTPKKLILVFLVWSPIVRTHLLWPPSMVYTILIQNYRNIWQRKYLVFQGWCLQNGTLSMYSCLTENHLHPYCLGAIISFCNIFMASIKIDRGSFLRAIYWFERFQNCLPLHLLDLAPTVLTTRKNVREIKKHLKKKFLQ